MFEVPQVETGRLIEAHDTVSNTCMEFGSIPANQRTWIGFSWANCNNQLAENP